jgi:hypothetical protein
MLRRLAADRGAWTSDPAGTTVSVQRRTAMFDLQRTPAASLSRIHLRMADWLKSAAGLDASGQIRHDPACGEFHMAWFAGRRGRCRRGPAQAKGFGRADEVQLREKTAPHLSDWRGLVCFRSACVPGGDFRAHPQRPSAVVRLIGRSPSQERNAPLRADNYRLYYSELPTVSFAVMTHCMPVNSQTSEDFNSKMYHYGASCIKLLQCSSTDVPFL